MKRISIEIEMDLDWIFGNLHITKIYFLEFIACTTAFQIGHRFLITSINLLQSHWDSTTSIFIILTFYYI